MGEKRLVIGINGLDNREDRSEGKVTEFGQVFADKPYLHLTNTMSIRDVLVRYFTLPVDVGTVSKCLLHRLLPGMESKAARLARIQRTLDTTLTVLEMAQLTTVQAKEVLVIAHSQGCVKADAVLSMLKDRGVFVDAIYLGPPRESRHVEVLHVVNRLDLVTYDLFRSSLRKPGGFGNARPNAKVRYVTRWFSGDCLNHSAQGYLELAAKLGIFSERV